MSKPDYVYSVQSGRLLKYAVESYNEATTVFIGHHGVSKVRGCLDCSMFFVTPDEALKELHKEYREGVHEAANEVRDAIAAYRTIKKVACMTFEEFCSTVPVEG